MKKGWRAGAGMPRSAADISLPPEQRRRQRKGKGRGTKGVVAQMDHANNHEAGKRRRAFEKRESRSECSSHV